MNTSRNCATLGAQNNSASGNFLPRRNRKKADSAQARLALAGYFATNFPPVCKLKIKDTGRCFIARARFGPRVLYAKAYRFENLQTYFEREYREKVMPVF